MRLPDREGQGGGDLPGPVDSSRPGDVIEAFEALWQKDARPFGGDAEEVRPPFAVDDDCYCECHCEWFFTTCPYCECRPSPETADCRIGMSYATTADVREHLIA